MLLRPRIPRQAGRSLAAAARQRCSRSVHHLAPLGHDFRDGVPGLLSADGFDMAWTQYQSQILDKLNQLVAGTDYEDQDVKTTLIATAREPSQAPVFNHASMAHNNHFFFKNLTPDAALRGPSAVPPALRARLDESFGSLDTLRREMVLTAAAMFGPGFVWLVKAGSHDYRVLTTYLAGSPYAAAHWRRQDRDLNSLGRGVDEAGRPSAAEFMRSSAQGASTGRLLPRTGGGGQFGQPPAGMPPGGMDAVPLLCLNTWEHVWLRDYGVGGKRAFAEAWWEVIDWEAVAEAAAVSRPVSPFR